MQRASIQELRRENANLRRALARLMDFRVMAYRDPLTGLRNRRYFDERLAEEVYRARRNPAVGLSIVAVDVNDFKKVNDSRGHVAGDETLKWVARFLEESVRSYDICCRVGGDEFMLILPATSSDGCERLIQRLRKRLSAGLDRRSRGVSLSIGAATWPAGGRTAQALIGSADAEMYADKRQQKANRRTRRAQAVNGAGAQL